MTKLTKTDTPNHTIASKTLEISPRTPNRPISSSSTHPRALTLRPSRSAQPGRARIRPNGIERIRTNPNTLDLLQADKTMTKLTKTATPNHTIATKTLEISPRTPNRLISSSSTHPRALTLRPSRSAQPGRARIRPNGIERIRTNPNTLDLLQADKTMTKLTKTATPNHTITSKTLEILPRKGEKKKFRTNT